MALSKTNPTGALKWERKYEKAILKIVDQFNDDVVDAFTHMWDTGELRTLEAGKFDATRFSPFVDKLADKKLNKPAKRVVKRIVPKAYAQGEMFAKTMVEGLFNIVLGDVLGVREKVGELVLKNEIEFKGFSTETSRRINRTISDGIIDGKPKYTIVNDLRDGFEMTRNNATRIVRTETMRATNRGVKDKYRSAGIEVVKWMATIQPGRTCEECKALNGKLFPIDKTPPIPKHPRCRCTLSPVPDPDWSEVEGWDGEKVTPPKKKETSPKEKKKEAPEKLPIAKTIKEANEVAVTYNLCEKAFFDGIKVEKANEILIAVNKYKRIAPRALKKIDYLGTIQGIMKDLSDQKFKLWVRSYAERKQISEDAARKLLLRTKKTRASPTPKNVLAEVVKDPTLSKSGIGVNKNLLNDNEFDSLMSYQVKSKFHPIGGDKGLAPHIDHEMGHMIDEAYDVGKDIELRKYYNSLKKDEIVSGLSKYGTYNYREFIAECWSEYQNNPKPREIAKTVGDRVLQLIREAT
jgi:SPP1 gp7 family putative phage head morphogenesis protein